MVNTTRVWRSVSVGPMLYIYGRMGEQNHTIDSHRSQQYSPEGAHPVIPAWIDDGHQQWGNRCDYRYSDDKVVDSDKVDKQPGAEVEDNANHDIRQ